MATSKGAQKAPTTTRKAAKRIGSSRKKAAKRGVGDTALANAKKKPARYAYHVDHDKRLDRWDVVDDTGGIIRHCHDVGSATHLAIRNAQHAYGQGDDVVVCVEQPDGHYKLAWASR